MGLILDIFVPGTPVAKGSTHAFAHKTTGKIITMQTNAKRQKPWASLIAFTAKEAIDGGPVDGPVSIDIRFTLRRPKNHYGTGKNATLLKTSAPQHHTKAPDIDKLLRCVLDALTGVVWHDDSQVWHVNAVKGYGHTEGAAIEVYRP